LEGVCTLRQAGPLVRDPRICNATEAEVCNAIEEPSSLRSDRSNVFHNLIDCRFVRSMEPEMARHSLRRMIVWASLSLPSRFNYPMP
jgi:DNA primase large subunit